MITGASSGIGLSLARVIAGRGAVVLLASRKAERLAAVARRVASEFPWAPRPLAVPCDVSSRRSVRALLGAATEKLGGVDILVNNAGVSVYGDTERTTLEDFESVMAVNFYGAVNGMLEVIPLMREVGRGLIVNIASLAAIHGVPYLGAYSASKAALVAVSESLRAELSQTGIRILLVYPGYTETGIFASERKLGGARRPRGRYAPADKVARAIVRSIEADKRELVVPLDGRLMAFFERTWPRLVDKVMERIAVGLRVEEGPHHA